MRHNRLGLRVWSFQDKRTSIFGDMSFLDANRLVMGSQEKGLMEPVVGIRLGLSSPLAARSRPPQVNP